METLPSHPLPYSGKIHRNFFTCAPSQELFDDLCAASDFPIVDKMVQITSGIDHGAPQFQRPFQYGKVEDDEIFAVFKKENWRAGRFGDGREFGVWYGAEDALTSVYEACWVAFRLGRDNVLKQGEVYTSDRKMVEAEVATEKALDVTRETSIFNQLVDPEDWSYCQDLGAKLHRSEIELLRTPSARKLAGICVPLFSPAPIKTCGFLYYLQIHVAPSGAIGVNSSRAEMNFSLNRSDLDGWAQL
jgi:RES domain.